MTKGAHPDFQRASSQQTRYPGSSSENLNMQVVIRARACEEAGQVLQGKGPWPSLPLALKSSLSPRAQLLTGPTDTLQTSHCVFINAYGGETSSTYCWWGKLMNQRVNAPADRMLKIKIFRLPLPFPYKGMWRHACNIHTGACVHTTHTRIKSSLAFNF